MLNTYQVGHLRRAIRNMEFPTEEDFIVVVPDRVVGDINFRWHAKDQMWYSDYGGSMTTALFLDVIPRIRKRYPRFLENDYIADLYLELSRIKIFSLRN